MDTKTNSKSKLNKVSSKAKAVNVKDSSNKSAKKQTLDKSVKEDDFRDVYDYLFTQLVFWLTQPSKLPTGHMLVNFDAIVESTGVIRPAIHDFKERDLDEGIIKTGVSFEHKINSGIKIRKKKSNTYKVSFSKAIPTRLFKIGDFSSNDYSRYSYNHFNKLNLMLSIIDDRFFDFMGKLNHAMRNRNATQNKEASLVARSKNNLQQIVSVLRKNKDGFTGISLPDLFEFNPESILPTHDLNYLISRTGKVKRGSKLYTYMFSRETSQSFCVQLSDILEKKILTLANELDMTPSVSKVGKSSELENWMSRMPKKTNTKQRMMLALQILGVRSEEKMLHNKISYYTASDIIFVFRALQRGGIILKNLDVTKLAVALEILTGKSNTKYLNGYMPSENFDADLQRLYNIKPESIAGAKKSIRKIARDVITEMETLIASCK